jgi:predicted metal-dependent phosphoesterase TrpH
VRIDLHCHRNRFSACSSLAPEDLVARARAAGLDGICLTEHDRLWPAEDLGRLAAGSGLVVLRGMEVTTEVGHVLVFGLELPPSGMFLARALAVAVRREGGLLALAHPGRAGQPQVPPEHVAELFDAVEVLNGSDGAAQNRAAHSIAARTPLPGIAGSDCHAPHEVGTVATVLPVHVTSEAELIAALRLGRHRVERLGQPEVTGEERGHAGHR